MEASRHVGNASPIGPGLQTVFPAANVSKSETPLVADHRKG
ncbi:hypothetical protein EYZ11_006905 [Aspergillus tanneri]|uniref:Uncharacterized protein n=1 Tax=Aspergillus tanneri TaxID=1220188 RepID=A0A4S3JJZ5_9EURO|nr:hypothetical protein EYZ11_006905 [Aspergillus tanneri]